MTDRAVTQASNYFDLQGLDQLRQKAQGNSKESIREVANQFESMFATMLIKSMRKTNEAFETESPFNNKQTKFYTDMQDNQLALDISRHGSLGLADALVRQLDPSSIANPKSVPVEQLTMPDDKQQKMLDLEKEVAPVELNKADRMSASTSSVSDSLFSLTVLTGFLSSFISSPGPLTGAFSSTGRTATGSPLLPQAEKIKRKRKHPTRRTGQKQRKNGLPFTPPSFISRVSFFVPQFPDSCEDPFPCGPSR